VSSPLGGGSFQLYPDPGYLALGRQQEGVDAFGKFAPWASGVLWPSSRSLASPMIQLGLDADVSGRWGDYKDVGGQQQKKIVGTTRSSDGTPLGGVVVDGFTTADDVKRGTVTSDAGGYFELCTPQSGSHYLVGYKAGSPDVAGASQNTLTPA